MSAPGLQGLRPWIMQRISAVYIALSLLYFAIVLLLADSSSASAWLAWVAIPYNNIALGLFLVAVLWHAWIGVRDVVLDYLQCDGENSGTEPGGSGFTGQWFMGFKGIIYGCD